MMLPRKKGTAGKPATDYSAHEGFAEFAMLIIKKFKLLLAMLPTFITLSGAARERLVQGLRRSAGYVN